MGIARRRSGVAPALRSTWSRPARDPLSSIERGMAMKSRLIRTTLAMTSVVASGLRAACGSGDGDTATDDESSDGQTDLTVVSLKPGSEQSAFDAFDEQVAQFGAARPGDRRAGPGLGRRVHQHPDRPDPVLLRRDLRPAADPPSPRPHQMPLCRSRPVSPAARGASARASPPALRPFGAAAGAL